MTARLVPECVQLVVQEREPFAPTYSLAMDTARPNHREVAVAWFSAPFA